MGAGANHQHTLTNHWHPPHAPELIKIGKEVREAQQLETVLSSFIPIMLQVNLDMTDSMGPGKLVRHMQNPSYTYDKYLICIGLGPSMLSVICKNPSYSGPSYPSSPVFISRLVYSNVSS